MIKGRRDGVEVVIEEVGVRVESHGSGGVTEHPLHRLHVGAGRDRETRSGVPEVVNGEGRRNGQVVLTSTLACAGEPPVTVRGRRQVGVAWPEDKVRGAATPARLAQVVDEEVGNRDAPGDVSLWRPFDDDSGDVDGVARHDEAMPVEVD